MTHMPLSRRGLLAAAGVAATASLTAVGTEAQAQGEQWISLAHVGRFRGVDVNCYDPRLPRQIRVERTPGYVLPAELRKTYQWSGNYPLTTLPSMPGQLLKHPTNATTIAQAYHRAYINTGTRDYLNRCISIVEAVYNDAIIATSPRGRARFAAYRFPWRDRAYTLPDPWVSAFGNSRMLNLCALLWKLTGDSKWHSRGMEFLNAYSITRNPSRPNDPWFTAIDSDGLLWFAEYAPANGDFAKVINGQPSGWYGVQVFGQLTGDAFCLALNKGLVASMLRMKDQVRRPGTCSWYYAGGAGTVDRLGTRNYGVQGYHGVNMSTFMSMWLVTGLTGFISVFDDLWRDQYCNRGGHPIWVGGNTHYILGYYDGKITSPAGLWMPAKGEVMPSDSRITVTEFGGPAGTWLRMASGPKRWMYLKERPDFVFQQWTPELPPPDWHDATARPIPAYVPANVRIQGKTITAAGKHTANKFGQWRWNSWLHVDGTSLYRGRRHYRAATGAFAGMWISEDQIKLGR